jgi:hypothetical protein
MREETLKCLVHVVEKLDEKHLQDILVRCITKLQNDTENSIRTNATIFLGRIAVKLKEGVRVRVLCVSFAKAMRDGFVHCRAAGLKAAIACLSLLDHSQLTSKLLPQVCSLLLDRSAEVRELSIKLLDLGLAVMKDQHKVLCVAEKNAAAALAASGESGKTAASEKESSSWGTSWSSLSLTLEKIAVGGTATATPVLTTAPAVIPSSSSSTLASDIHKTQTIKGIEKEKEKEKEIVKEKVITKSAKSESNLSDSRYKIDDNASSAAVREVWGGDTSFNDWDSNYNVDTSTSYGQKNEGNSSSGGWGDDDDLDLDEGHEQTNSGSSTPSQTPDKSIKTPGGLTSSASKAKAASDATGKVSSMKIKKGAAPVSSGPSKRMSIGAESSDNWDDF